MITLAALSLGGLMPLLIEIIIAGLIFYLLWWFIGYVGIPEPFNKVARVVIALVALIYLINLLLSLSGQGFITR